MAEVEWTEEAKYWLQQIYDYIARDNEEAAWQVILGFMIAFSCYANSRSPDIATKNTPKSTSAFCSTVTTGSRT